MELKTFISISKEIGIEITADHEQLLGERAVMQPDKFNDIVIQRMLVAKGMSLKEAGEYVGVDSSAVQMNLRAKTNIGDNRAWTAKNLRTSEYKDIGYNPTDLTKLVEMYPKFDELKEVLIA